MDYLNFYYNKWHYSIANVTPASDGKIVLVSQDCFGPLQCEEYGIDAEGRPYYRYEWIENDLFEDDNMTQNITEDKLISVIENKCSYFKNGSFPEAALAVSACEEILAWLKEKYRKREVSEC